MPAALARCAALAQQLSSVQQLRWPATAAAMEQGRGVALQNPISSCCVAWHAHGAAHRVALQLLHKWPQAVQAQTRLERGCPEAGPRGGFLEAGAVLVPEGAELLGRHLPGRYAAAQRLW